MDPVSSRILLPLNNSLDVFITVEKSLELLKLLEDSHIFYYLRGVYGNSCWNHTYVDSEFLSYLSTTGSLGLFPFFPILTVDRVIRRNSYRNLCVMMDTFPFSHPLKYDDFF